MKLLKKSGIYVLLLAMTLTMVACGPSGGETTTTKAPTTTAKPTTTAAPTTTPEPTTTVSDATVIPVDNLSTYMSIGENKGWLDTVFSLGEGNTGRQYVSFNLTPLADNVDGGVHFADGGKNVTGFADLAIMVRMAQGVFDARNGDNFEKLADVPVATNTTYFVELYADMDGKTYTVYVTPAGGSRTLLAENYAFRTTANDADDLGKIFFVSAAANDELKVDTVKRMSVYTQGKEYWSYGENYGWQQHSIYLGRPYTGNIKIAFDFTPTLENVDASVDFADSTREVYGFGDLSILIRLNDGKTKVQVESGKGYIDARNGVAMEALNIVEFSANVTYHFDVEANMDAKTYSVWVTAPDVAKTKIAENYAFRESAADADDIGQVFVISASANDQAVLKNLTIEDAQGSNAGETAAPTTSAAPTTTQAGTTTTAAPTTVVVPTTTKAGTTTTTAAPTTTKAGTTTTTAAPTTTKTGTTTTAAGGSTTKFTKTVTLNLGLPEGYDVTSEAIVKNFKAAYPNITVVTDTRAWGEFTGSMAAAMAAGTAPDVWFQENAVILGYGAAGNAVDLAAYIARDLKTSDFVSSLFVAKVGTKVWGIPHGANPVALAYNKSIFNAAGEAFPTSSWTYNDMIAAAKRIQAKNGQIYGFLTNTGITTGWFPWIKAYGGSALTNNLTKANFLDPKTKAGVVAWANTYSVDGIAPSAGENRQSLFGSNAGAMYFLQYSEAVMMNKTYPQLNWDTAMIPKAVDGSGKRYVPNLSNSWFIWSGAKKDNQDAAWEWIKFYLSASSQDLVAQMGAALPVRISSMSKISTSTKPYNKAAFTDGIAQGGVSMDENTTWDQWRRVVNNALGGVYDDPTTVDAALAQLQIDVQAILDK